MTLRGRVLPIGGLKEKLLAALRFGVKKVLIPADNVRDLKEIPEIVTKGMEIIPVSRMDEVLAHALVRQPEPIEWKYARDATQDARRPRSRRGRSRHRDAALTNIFAAVPKGAAVLFEDCKAALSPIRGDHVSRICSGGGACRHGFVSGGRPSGSRKPQTGRSPPRLLGRQQRCDHLQRWRADLGRQGAAIRNRANHSLGRSCLRPDDVRPSGGRCNPGVHFARYRGQVRLELVLFARHKGQRRPHRSLCFCEVRTRILVMTEPGGERFNTFRLPVAGAGDALGEVLAACSGLAPEPDEVKRPRRACPMILRPYSIGSWTAG